MSSDGRRAGGRAGARAEEASKEASRLAAFRDKYGHFFDVEGIYGADDGAMALTSVLSTSRQLDPAAEEA